MEIKKVLRKNNSKRCRVCKEILITGAYVFVNKGELYPLVNKDGKQILNMKTLNTEVYHGICYPKRKLLEQLKD